jgi:pimeloyl-ACP methyl ester carboxylesterase
MRRHFERKGETIDSYSSYIAARSATMPVLVIHDEDDKEVNVRCARHIHENLPNGKLMLTAGLGHRKILGNPDVIKQTINFAIN